MGVRKQARVPDSQIVDNSVNSIQNPKAIKARADLHTNLPLNRPGSQNYKTSVMPTKRNKPGLAVFKEIGSSETNTKMEDPSARWDKAPTEEARTQLTHSILSHLEKIDAIEEAEVAKDLDQMQNEPEPERPKAKKLSFGEYMKRKQTAVENKSNEGDKTEDISAVLSSRSDAGADKDEVTVVSDRDDGSSVVQSVVINGGEKDDGDSRDLPTLTDDIEEGEGNHDADVTTISDNEDEEANGEEIQDKQDPDVTTVPDSDEEENASEKDVTTLSGDDSGHHAPDVTVYPGDDEPQEESDEDIRSGSVSSVSIQTEIITNINLQGNPPPPPQRDDSDSATMFTLNSPTSTRNSTPEILLEVNDPGSSHRQDSPGPEVVQITKSIPEDAELKITLTKSPQKSANTFRSSPLPTIELEENEEEVTESPLFKSSRAETVPRVRETRKIASKSSPKSANTCISSPPTTIELEEDEEEAPESPVYKSSRAETGPRVREPRKIASKLKILEPDDSERKSFEETTRPKRERSRFPGLSEIDKAKLKNRPYKEREKAFKSLKRDDEKETSIDLTSDEDGSFSPRRGSRKVIVTDGSEVGKCKLSPKTKKSSRRRRD